MATVKSEAAVSHPTTESEGERLARRRRNEETKEELRKIQAMKRVNHSLKTIVANTLARTQLQKVQTGPIHRMKLSQSLPVRRRSTRRRQRYPPPRRRSADDERNSLSDDVNIDQGERRGHHGGEGVKKRRKEDEEELKTLRRMGKVRERLKERDKVRDQAYKLFKHRYELDPESTQKSNCILVTGYEDGVGSTHNAVELIRQQSIVVIENFFNQPANSRMVLSRLTSAQRDSIEAIEMRKVKGYLHTVSEPFTVETLHEGEGEGKGEAEHIFKYQGFCADRPREVEGEEEEGGEESDEDSLGMLWGEGYSDGHYSRATSDGSTLLHTTGCTAGSSEGGVIPQAPPVPQPQHSLQHLHEAPPPAPPISSPSGTNRLLYMHSAPDHLQSSNLIGQKHLTTRDDEDHRTIDLKPSPPVAEGKIMADCSESVHVEGVLSDDVKVSSLPTDEGLSISSLEVATSLHAVSQSRDVVGGGAMMTMSPDEDDEGAQHIQANGVRDEVKLEKERSSPVAFDDVDSPPPRLNRSFSYVTALETADITPTAIQTKEHRHQRSRSATTRDKKKSSKGIFGIRQKKGVKKGLSLSIGSVASANGDHREETNEGETRPDSPKYKPMKSKPKPTTTRSPCPPPLARPISTQYSVPSFTDPTNTRYYTPLSPRVDRLTGTHVGDDNPFSEAFDRAMQNQSEPHPHPRPRPPEAQSGLTQLPEEAIEDKNFQEFLRMHGAKPTRSMYITYQIMMISEQIDCKYSKQLNQALDAIFHEVLQKQLTWENFSTICRQLMFMGEGQKDGLLMVPAFGRRLLGFLPDMRDVIMRFTQNVFDQYATDWLIMKGGWGELLCHYDQDGGEGAGPGDPCREGAGHMEGMYREDMYQTAMGYGLVTPAPEFQDRSLATGPGMDIGAVGTVMEDEVSVYDNEDEPHPLDSGVAIPTMGSDLFLNPVQNVVPPIIGHGLRRVLSVEVLFTSDEDDTTVEETVSNRPRPLSRVSSVPSLCCSTPTLSSPISIPSRKRLSTDRSSSGLGMSPATPSSSHVFSLPSMRRNKPRPPSDHSLASSTDYTRQLSSTSTDSSIHIITAGGSMSPAGPASPKKKLEPSQLALNKRHSNGQVTTGSGHHDNQQDLPGSMGRGLSEATPSEDETSKTPPTNHQTPLPSSDRDQAPPPANEGHQYQSSFSYADYGLESENDGTTGWEWARNVLLASPLVIAAGLTVAYFLFRAKKY